MYKNSPEGNTSEATSLLKPRGIALIICDRINWDAASDNPEAQNFSCPRNITQTLDTWLMDCLPYNVGPIAAYVHIAGTGSTSLSLSLEAPNGEVVVTYHNVADNWGVLGTYEWVVHIHEFTLNQSGIYHWQLCHGHDVLLECPMQFILIS